MSNTKKGFTLLELLIVISIIGILIAVVAVAYTTVQQKSRDARRKGDIKAISDALEQYYADNESSYPSDTNCTGIVGATYLPGGVPTDPKGGTYNYTCRSAASAYCICAQLEGGGGNATTAAGSTSCSYGSGDYFCLSNLQ
ncbi:MAG: prepilin-type N-terminal cleavage/methylation domain-containing protein [Candidatus Pacebacteria bacterium]|nr:prepilin-type N-terminal cleavage/methylation domain-containing protein [Candidatus Paceibacterota bacterium]